MLKRRHHILEMQAIPRERKRLQSAISVARHEQRKHNLIMFASGNLIAWGLYVLFVWGPAQHSAGVELLVTHTYYLPLIIK
jgi:hypothetical protein